MKTKAFFFTLFLIGFTFSLSAQKRTPGVNKRQVKQQKRIHQGVKDGSVKKGEYYRLQKQQRKVNRSKKAAKSRWEGDEKRAGRYPRSSKRCQCEYPAQKTQLGPTRSQLLTESLSGWPDRSSADFPCRLKNRFY